MARALRRTPVAAAVLGLVIVAIGALAFWKPFLTKDRKVVTSTPSLPGVFVRKVLPLSGGQTACVRPVPLSTATGQAELTVVARDRHPTDLLVEARGPGYRSSGVIPAIAYPKGDTFAAARLQPPPRDLTGEICVTPRQRPGVGLVGTDEPPFFVPAELVVNGQRKQGQEIALTLLEPRRQSLASRFGTVLDHASALTGAVPAWLLWPIALAVTLGVPLLLFLAYAATLRRDS
jgi:hypothetical protein